MALGEVGKIAEISEFQLWPKIPFKLVIFIMKKYEI